MVTRNSLGCGSIGSSWASVTLPASTSPTMSSALSISFLHCVGGTLSFYSMEFLGGLLLLLFPMLGNPFLPWFLHLFELSVFCCIFAACIGLLMVNGTIMFVYLVTRFILASLILGCNSDSWRSVMVFLSIFHLSAASYRY